MPDMGDIDFSRSGFERSASRLRLDTLVRLRWLALAGQCMAVAVVSWWLEFPMNTEASLAVIAVSVALNLALRFNYPVSQRLSDGAASALLAYDILQLAALLYLTGGLENPFAMLLMAPVMISAASLAPSRTVTLGVLAISAATVLFFAHEPLPWAADDPLRLPAMYRAGVWSAILLGLVFIGIYAWRVTEEARQLAQALAATELVLAREQHLSQLDGLAAAAAHELGTPLATIALVAKELDLIGPKEGPMAEDIALLREQVDRCRGILGKITSLGNDPGPLESMRLSMLVEEIAAPQRPFDVQIDVETRGAGPEPVCRRNPGLLYGLGNLAENAVDFARERVRMTARWDDDSVAVTIRDDGPGFAPEILSRVGEPYVTKRGDRGAQGGGGGGMGLGLFIAKTLLERSGATLSMSNALPPQTGALVTVTWQRLAFERGVAASRPPLDPGFPL
jgi:two-component system, sensor histidine kinase RegB